MTTSEDFLSAASAQASTVAGCRSLAGDLAIDMLPDDVLLYIFNTYRWAFGYPSEGVCYDGRCKWPWNKFVHVCRRWRHLIFAFPGHLNLHLVCNSKTDMQGALNTWPALPLSLSANLGTKDANADEDDIIDALGHHEGLAGIHLGVCKRPQLEKCIALMQKQFPALRSLEFEGDDEIEFVIPDAFLGGSSPLLQDIFLGDFRFPGLPKLLSSTSDLVNLNLWCFPMTGEGHMSPDAMTTCLSVLTKLRSLSLTFPLQTTQSSSYPTDQCPPSSSHTILPALTYLSLDGPHGYLEDLVGRIDAPLLNSGHFDFYDEPTFDTPRILRFIHRTKMSKLLGEVEVHFRGVGIRASFRSSIGLEMFYLSFPCSGFPAQVAIVQRIHTQCPSLFSHVESLKLLDDVLEEKKWWEAIRPWQGILRPFSAVQTLHICGIAVVPHVAHILGGLEEERATEVFPALRTIELGCSEQDDTSGILPLLGPFLVAHEKLEHPVVVNFSSRSLIPSTTVVLS